MQAVMPALFWPLSSTITMMLLAVGVQLTVMATSHGERESMTSARLSSATSPAMRAGCPRPFMRRMPRLVDAGTARKSAPFARFEPRTSMFTGTAAPPIVRSAWKRKASGTPWRPPTWTKRPRSGRIAATASPRRAPTTGGAKAFFATLARAAVQPLQRTLSAWPLPASLALPVELFSSTGAKPGGSVLEAANLDGRVAARAAAGASGSEGSPWSKVAALLADHWTISSLLAWSGGRKSELIARLNSGSSSDMALLTAPPRERWARDAWAERRPDAGRPSGGWPAAEGSFSGSDPSRPRSPKR
mmetsp:Transcript_68430/g.211588  ORF Transcript_68430/g.211588 Transcript_68430/m.211588 type:complete len:303 (+) Transcript_68430:183-1091(+)